MSKSAKKDKEKIIEKDAKKTSKKSVDKSAEETVVTVEHKKTSKN